MKFIKNLFSLTKLRLKDMFLSDDLLQNNRVED